MIQSATSPSRRERSEVCSSSLSKAARISRTTMAAAGRVRARLRSIPGRLPSWARGRLRSSAMIVSSSVRRRISP